MGINTGQLFGGRNTSRGLLSPNEDTVRVREIINSSTFGKELGVAQNLEGIAVLIVLKNTFNRLGGTNGDGTLFDDDLVGGGDLCNMTSAELTIFDICGPTSTNSLSLGGSVDGNKDDISVLDFLVKVGREEKISTTTFLDDIEQFGLVNWELVSVPSIDLLLGNIDDGDLNLRIKK